MATFIFHEIIIGGQWDTD